MQSGPYSYTDVTRHRLAQSVCSLGVPTSLVLSMVSFHGPAPLQIPRGQPAEETPNQTHCPAGEHICRVMYAQIDPTEADQADKHHHDPEEVDLQQEPGFEPGEQNPQREIHHRAKTACPLGKLGLLTQRHGSGSGRSGRSQQAAEQASASGRPPQTRVPRICAGATNSPAQPRSGG